MLAPGKQAKRFGKNETETLQQTFWGENYGHRNKFAQLLVITLRQISFLVSILDLENGFWAEMECSHPESRPKESENLNLRHYNRLFGVESTAIAIKLLNFW